MKNSFKTSTTLWQIVSKNRLEHGAWAHAWTTWGRIPTYTPLTYAGTVLRTQQAWLVGKNVHANKKTGVFQNVVYQKNHQILMIFRENRQNLVIFHGQIKKIIKFNDFPWKIIKCWWFFIENHQKINDFPWTTSSTFGDFLWKIVKIINI